MKFDVTDFGAVGDGVTLNTAAIRAAVTACAAQGGGEVVFPVGTFVSGTIYFEDGVTLRLERGAILKASDDLADFDDLPLPTCDVGKRIGFLYAEGKHDIGIEGKGMIDFNHEPFFKDAGRMPFVGMQDPLTEEQEREATLNVVPRVTAPVTFIYCERVRMCDVTLIHSPCWTVTFESCHGVMADHVTIENSLIVPNCDGIGTSRSTDIIISNCNISCADDCLTFCGSKHAVVSNCILRTRSTAIRIGYIDDETYDIAISNIVIHDSNRGVILQGSRESRVRNVMISNMIMHNRLYQGAWWGSGEPLVIVSQGNGSVEHVTMSNVRAESAHGIALSASNAQGIRDIHLHDWSLTITGEGDTEHTRFIDLRDEPCVPLAENVMPWYYARGVEGLKLREMDVTTAGAGEKYDITPLVV